MMHYSRLHQLTHNGKIRRNEKVQVGYVLEPQLNVEQNTATSFVLATANTSNALLFRVSLVGVWLSLIHVHNTTLFQAKIL